MSACLGPIDYNDVTRLQELVLVLDKAPDFKIDPFDREVTCCFVRDELEQKHPDYRDWDLDTIKAFVIKEYIPDLTPEAWRLKMREVVDDAKAFYWAHADNPCFVCCMGLRNCTCDTYRAIHNYTRIAVEEQEKK